MDDLPDAPPSPPPGPGYAARCKACNSARRVDIDTRLLAGESARAVSKWLASLGEQISHQGLTGHRAEHLNLREAVAARVDTPPPDIAAAITEIVPAYNAAVERIVADVNVLDEVAAHALAVARALAPKLSTGKVDMATAVAFNGALSNARAAVTDRHELLYGKRVDVTSNGQTLGGPPDPTDQRWKDLQREHLGAERQGIDDVTSAARCHGDADRLVEE